jgi:hypothetical protein
VRKQIVSKFKLNPFTVVVMKHAWPYFQSRFPQKSFQTCFFQILQRLGAAAIDRGDGKVATMIVAEAYNGGGWQRQMSSR